MRKDLSLLTDFYELTMANSYYELGKKDEIAYFDYFFIEYLGIIPKKIFFGLK